MHFTFSVAKIDLGYWNSHFELYANVCLLLIFKDIGCHLLILYDQCVAESLWRCGCVAELSY